MAAGFEPKKIYEVVYRAQDPPLVGVGPAAVRDTISKIKYSGATELGLAPGAIKRGIAFGISQSGRFLRTYLYYGFNEDESHRKVFDGVMPHVAGSGRGSFNHRFAQPSRDGHPYINFFYPTDIFPFTDAEQSDPETGLTDGLLTHATKPAHQPNIFYTNSSYEYWGRSASLYPHHRRRHEGRAAAGERARLSALRRTTRRGRVPAGAIDRPAVEQSARLPLGDAIAAARDESLGHRRHRAAGERAAPRRQRHAGDAGQIEVPEAAHGEHAGRPA